MRFLTVSFFAFLLVVPSIRADEITCDDIKVNKLHLGMAKEQASKLVELRKKIKNVKYHGLAVDTDWTCYKVRDDPPDKGRYACFNNNKLVWYQTTRPDAPNHVVQLITGAYGSPTRGGDLSTGFSGTGMIAAWEWEACDTILRVSRVMTRRFGKAMLFADTTADQQDSRAYDTAIILESITAAASAADDFLN